MIDACGGYHEYTGGCSVQQGDTMSRPGVFSTLEGYHEHTGGISRVHWQILVQMRKSHHQISKLPTTGSSSASNSRLRIPDKDNFDA